MRKNLNDFNLFGNIGFEIQNSSAASGGAGAGRHTEFANLNERQATLLFTYMRNSEPVKAFKIRLVQEFYRLAEAAKANIQPAVPLLPAQVALATLQANLEIMKLVGVPASYAVQETARMMSDQSGLDYCPMLTQAECMNNVPMSDVMLEPTELGEHFKMSGSDANKLLAAAGLQSKQGGDWVPTPAGKPMCIRHAWTVRGKSGYNLKWRFTDVEAYFLNTRYT